MILLLYGKDELAVHRRLQELRDQADGGSGMLVTNLAVVEGRDAKPADILGPAMAPPFLAPYRIVLVEGLLDRYEAGPNQPPGTRGSRSVDGFAALFDGLEAGLPPTTMLVFTGGGIGKSNAMATRLARIAGATVEEHAELKGEQLIRFIRGEAEVRGIRLRNGPFRRNRPPDDDVARLGDPAAILALLLQSDTLAIVNELDKLALYTMGRDATVDDLVESCGAARQFNAFALSDAALDGNLAKAFAVLTWVIDEGEASQLTLANLIAAYRPLATVVEMLADGATSEEIGKAINRPWPGLRDAAIRRARALGPDGLRRAYEALIEADRRTKSGEVDEWLAIEIALTKLCALVRPAGQRVIAGRR